METATESACLCQYLHTLAEERELSVERLTQMTGICPAKLQEIMSSTAASPTLEELVRIGKCIGR